MTDKERDVIENNNTFLYLNKNDLHGINYQRMYNLEKDINNLREDDQEILRIIRKEKNNILNNLLDIEKKNNNIIYKNNIKEMINYIRVFLSKLNQEQKYNIELKNTITTLLSEITTKLDKDNYLYVAATSTYDINELLNKVKQIPYNPAKQYQLIKEEEVRKSFINYLRHLSDEYHELYLVYKYVYEEFKNLPNNIYLLRAKEGLEVLAYYTHETTINKECEELIINEITKSNTSLKKENEKVFEKIIKSDLELVLSQLALTRRLNCESENYNKYERILATDLIKEIRSINFSDGKISSEEKANLIILNYINTVNIELKQCIKEQEKKKRKKILKKTR